MTNNMSHMHDQALAYIRYDALQNVIDGELSFETLAAEFEKYWRAKIGKEVADKHKLSTGLLAPVDPLLLTIWKLEQ